MSCQCRLRDYQSDYSPKVFTGTTSSKMLRSLSLISNQARRHFTSTTLSSTSFFSPLTTTYATPTSAITTHSQQQPQIFPTQLSGYRFSSVLKKRRKKMRKHKLRKMRRVLRRSNKNATSSQ